MRIRRDTTEDLTIKRSTIAKVKKKHEGERQPSARPFKGFGKIRSRGSDGVWVPVEFMIYHDDQGKIRSFGYVRRKDGSDIPDGEYEMVDELGERRRRWKKRNGKWQVKWRRRWSTQA